MLKKRFLEASVLRGIIYAGRLQTFDNELIGAFLGLGVSVQLSFLRKIVATNVSSTAKEDKKK